MRALIFDTETTGLLDNRLLALDKQPEIIEICARLIFAGQVEDELDCLIQPSRPIPPEVTKITGLKNEHVSGHAPASAVLPKLIALAGQADMVVAHNLSFDMEMVELELERANMQINWPEPYCTVEQTIHLKGFRLSLGALHQHLFDAPFKDAHRAAFDVSALTRCFLRLIELGCV
jgi:DNA polymerase III alpha subunit (gram-positive type)